MVSLRCVFLLALPLIALCARPHVINNVNHKYQMPDPKLKTLGKSYIQFGSHEDYPHDYNCTAWSHLFLSNGVRNAPGIPPSSGWVQLESVCEFVRGQFTTLLDISHGVIPVRSWNNELRVAIRWEVVGTKPDGSIERMDAISTLYTDQNYNIEIAWDFMPQMLSSTSEVLAPEPNITEVARLYASFGADPDDTTKYDCSKWASLFRPDGIRNTPGQPPVQGPDQLLKMCNTVRSQFSELFPITNEIITVTSWNTEKRVAFYWFITGIEAKTEKKIYVPAITTLFMDPDGTIQTAWDFLDPSQL